VTLGDPKDWITSGWSGGFAQYIKRNAMACYRLPDHLSWEEGALVEPLAVSVHGVRKARMLGGETVVVIGAGTIGLTAIAAARAMGAGTLFATARHPHQKEMAIRLGADAVFSPDGAELMEAVSGVTDGAGADIVIETVGGRHATTLAQSFKVARGQGRIIVLGKFDYPMEIDLLPPFMQEQSVIFSQCYSIMDEIHDFEIAVGMMASGRLPLKDMVTHTFPLDQARKALDTAFDKSTGCVKVQLLP
jgi:2-desacetyl-2-hydroxyethyl bacteriochlorophyllide A dehydrogenase